MEPIQPNIDLKTFDVLKHNGCVTMFNPETGNHRTLRIKTEEWSKGFQPRVVSLLCGPDNGNHFRAFAFVTPTGVKVWKKFENTGFAKYADLLNRARLYAEQRGLVYQIEGHCRRCNKLLTHPESLTTGLGPVCDGRIVAQQKIREAVAELKQERLEKKTQFVQPLQLVG